MRRASMFILMAALLGCGGGSGPVGEQPSWRKSGETPRPTALQPIVFAPSEPGAAVYNPAESRAHPPDELAEAVLVLSTEVAGRIDRPIPRLEPRLSRAAAELAAIAPADAPLAYPLIEFAMQRHGIIEPSPHIIVIWGEKGGKSSEIAETLAERLEQILGGPSVPHNRLGVGSAERGGGEVCHVIAYQSSYIDTEPIPRSLPAGGKVAITGRVHPPYADPQVFITRESGDVDRLPVKPGSAGGFQSALSCGRHSGKQQVEITAVDASGSTVLANFPLWCDERPPQRLVYEATIDVTQPVRTEGEAVARMLELLNRDRASHNLPPLIAEPRLAAVARAHSREMQQSNRVAHVSPTTGSAADRVAQARIRTSVVLENVARAYGVAQAQSGLMNSPGHRANILAKEASHVGIGVVFGKPEAGGTEMFITQVFARLPVDMPPERARRIVIESVQRSRPQITEDPKLTEIARTFARRVAAGEDKKKVGAWASEQLRRIGSSYLSVSTLITAVADLESFDPRTGMTEPRLSNFGLGIARGDHPVMGDDAYHLVILLAER